jgi:uncharacterized protein YecT (DUF1311 family)
VSLVTSIEVFFRGAVTSLIDHGPPYVDKADSLIKDLKFDVSSVRALQGQEITLGAVASLVPSFQNLKNICSTMDTILGVSFMPAISNVHNRWEVEVKQQPKKPIIGDVDLLAKVLSKLFECRHIAVHELPQDLELSTEDIHVFIDVTEQFLKASLEYISELLDPGAPLQQQPMNARANQQASDANTEMEVQYAKLRGLVGEEREVELDAAQASWRAFRAATASFDGNEYRGGTISPLIYSKSYKALTDERTKFLKRVIYDIENDPRYN